MEVLPQDASSLKTHKPTLAFSIDKIMGVTETTDEESEVDTREEQNNSPKTKHKHDDDFICDNEKSGFQPVKRTKHSDSDVTKQQEILTAQYQHAAAMIKNEIQKRQMMPYMGRELFDINMNNVSCLHPAFMLGRFTPEEYRSQILQNFSVFQNQWPNINTKDNGHLLDAYKWTNSKYFNNERSQQILDQSKSLLKSPKQHSPPNKPSCSPRSPDQGTLERLDEQTPPDMDVSNVTSTENSKDDADLMTSPNPAKRGISKSQKSFSCPECGKLFNAHYNLTRHMPVHTGKGHFTDLFSSFSTHIASYIIYHYMKTITKIYNWCVFSNKD